MYRKEICNAILILLLSSCIKPVDIDLATHTQKLVINTFLSNGDTIKVHLSKSQGQKEALQSYLLNALVVISAEGLIDTLELGADGWYCSEWTACENTKYDIEVSSAGFETVIASETVPEPPVFTFENYIARTKVNEMGYYSSSLDVVIDDDLTETQYYAISQKNHKTVRRVDEGTYGNGIQSPSPELLIQNEDKTTGILFFSNAPFHDKNELRFTIEFAYSNNIDSVDIYVRALSFEYYTYIKSLTKHTWGQNTDDIWGGYDIYPLYSNIDNAYGIVAAYAESKKSFYTYRPLLP